MRHWSEREYDLLNRALSLLGDVQCEMARKNEPEEDWIELYRTRVSLGREIYNRRPLSQTEFSHRYAEERQP